MPNIFEKSVGRETLITFAVLFGMMLVSALCIVIMALIDPYMKYFWCAVFLSTMTELLAGMVLGIFLIIVIQHSSWEKSKANQEKKMEEGNQSTNQNNGSTIPNDYVQCPTPSAPIENDYAEIDIVKVE